MLLLRMLCNICFVTIEYRSIEQILIDISICIPLHRWTGCLFWKAEG